MTTPSTPRDSTRFRLGCFTCACAWLALALVAGGQTLVCHGVLGNSGAAGDHLVRFDRQAASGLGVVADAYGTLWDRGGSGTLNRYALDGRLLAQYGLPNGSNRDNDQIVLVDSTLVLLIGGKLHTLAIDAPPGSAATPMNLAATCLSPSAWNGRVAAARQNQVVLIDIPAATITPVADGDAKWVELGSDGAVYALQDGKLNKFVNGQPVADGWPRPGPGERPQLLGGAWFGHAWHGTIKRFSETLQPDPGVVLGGASGSFIGHLDENAELVNGRGLARLGDHLYAISGLDGVLHLLEWDTAARQMSIIRRLGSLPSCSGLAIDVDGNIFYRAGVWKWIDQPDTPLRLGVNNPEAPGVGQPVMLDGRNLCAPGFLWGQPAFYSGPLDRHLHVQRLDPSCALRRGMVGSATYQADGQRLLLVVDAKGTVQGFRIAANGRYAGEAGDIALETAAPLAQWSSLGTTAEGTLLAAADGHIVAFQRQNGQWRESRRWNQWGDGPADRFGQTIALHVDGNRLWVTDSHRHRLLLFATAGGPPLASFGNLDQPGNDLGSLAMPTIVAAAGRRAVVYDRDNQRLLKLFLED